MSCFSFHLRLLIKKTFFLSFKLNKINIPAALDEGWDLSAALTGGPCDAGSCLAEGALAWDLQLVTSALTGFSAGGGRACGAPHALCWGGADWGVGPSDCLKTERLWPPDLADELDCGVGPGLQDCWDWLQAPCGCDDATDCVGYKIWLLVLFYFKWIHEKLTPFGKLAATSDKSNGVPLPRPWPLFLLSIFG